MSVKDSLYDTDVDHTRILDGLCKKNNSVCLSERIFESEQEDVQNNGIKESLKKIFKDAVNTYFTEDNIVDILNTSLLKDNRFSYMYCLSKMIQCIDWTEFCKSHRLDEIIGFYDENGVIVYDFASEKPNRNKYFLGLRTTKLKKSFKKFEGRVHMFSIKARKEMYEVIHYPGDGLLDYIEICIQKRLSSLLKYTEYYFLCEQKNKAFSVCLGDKEYIGKKPVINITFIKDNKRIGEEDSNYIFKIALKKREQKKKSLENKRKEEKEKIVITVFSLLAFTVLFAFYMKIILGIIAIGIAGIILSATKR